MKRVVCAVSLLLPFGVTAAPPSSKVVADPQAREALLRAWEKGYQAPRDFSCRIAVTCKDDVYQTEVKSLLEVTGSTPHLLLVTEKDQRGKTMHQFLMTEKELRDFDHVKQMEFLFPPSGKPMWWLDFPSLLGQELRESWTLLFFRLNSSYVREWFQIQEIREDNSHLHLTLRPYAVKDRSLFLQELHITMNKTTWSISAIAFEHNNGTHVDWQIAQRRDNLTPAVTLQLIRKELPEGWTQVELQPRKKQAMP